MSRKSWKRLAGCFVIELLLAAGPCAADSDYLAAAIQFRGVKALSLEDRHGNRAVIAQAAFMVTRALSDRAVVQILKAHTLDRPGVLLRGAPSGEGTAEELVTAVEAALGQMAPALLRFADGALSVTGADGRCLASLGFDGSLALEHCGPGEMVRPPIRSAFQVVEPARGLMRRGDQSFLYPIQAISLGSQLTILALGGDAPVTRFRGKKVIVTPFANDSTAMPDDARVSAAIRQVLARVK